VPSYEAAGADVLLFFDVPLLDVFYFFFGMLGRSCRRHSPYYFSVICSFYSKFADSSSTLLNVERSFLAVVAVVVLMVVECRPKSFLNADHYSNDGKEDTSTAFGQVMGII